MIPIELARRFSAALILSLTLSHPGEVDAEGAEPPLGSFGEADEETSAEEQEPGTYVIEGLRSVRRCRRNKRQLEFLVKWEGYSERESTWEPEREMLRAHCEKAVLMNSSSGMTGIQRRGRQENKVRVQELDPLQRVGHL